MPIYMKIDGIKGESRDDRHKDELDVLSFSWGASQQGTFAAGGGGGAGKVQIQDFHFTTKYSKASPKLFLACATGEHIKDAHLTLRGGGEQGQEYLKYSFSNVMISSYQTGGTADDRPTESISFVFEKINIDYWEQREDGSLGEKTSAGWDLGANKKI